MPPPIVYKATVVQAGLLLPPAWIVEVVEAALRARAADRVLVPRRQHIESAGNTLLTMPALGEGYCGVKLVSVAPGDSARALPVTNGVMDVHGCARVVGERTARDHGNDVQRACSAGRGGLLAYKHFIAVGSYRPDMQELPNAVFRLSGCLAIDSDHALNESGDVLNPVRRGVLREQDVLQMEECVTGQRSVRVVGTTAYKSAGAAFYDLYVARAFYEAAQARGLGRAVDL